MARIRSIKPEFPQSESMGRVSRDARLTFIQLWTLADDEGRLRGNSRMLASLLFPYDDDAPRLIDTWLDELEREHCINRYKIDGDSYIQISKWLIHQKIDKPSKSKIPEFDESYRILANDRGGIKDQGSKDQGEEGSGEEDMSGKPDEAREVLDHLNTKTESSYRPVDSNLKLIRERLKSGVSLEQVKAVIDAKVAQWGSDPKMQEFLRPTTLFRASNFEQYLGQLGRPAIAQAARASPGSYAQQRDQQRDETIAILTGRRPNERTTDAIDVEARPID